MLHGNRGLRMMRSFLVAAALGMVGLVGTVGASSSPFEGLTELDGKPALVRQDAKTHRLVVFWGTWCEECRSKLGKELVSLDHRADLSVVTVNTDRDEGRVREFVAKEGIRLPVLRDPSKALRKSLQVFSVPHWALYRRSATGFELVTSEAAFDETKVLVALKSDSGVGSSHGATR